MKEKLEDTKEVIKYWQYINDKDKSTYNQIQNTTRKILKFKFPVKDDIKRQKKNAFV